MKDKGTRMQIVILLIKLSGFRTVQQNSVTINQTWSSYRIVLRTVFNQANGRIQSVG